MATKKVDGVKQKLVDTEAVTVERRVVACNAQFIAVDAGKLSKGLKTTFEGVAMVFDSIGLPVQLGLTMDLEDGVSDEHSASVESTAPTESDAPATEKVAVKKKAKTDTKPEPASEPIPVADTQEEVLEELAPEAEPEQAATSETKEAPVAKAASVSSITIDDITKIIVQKIKQNRKNNEKIGAILKTYEVARVGDLHPSKYEEFLTDLSAI